MMRIYPLARQTGWLAILVLVLIINIGPLIWMLMASLKSESQVIAMPPTFLPPHPTLENYTHLVSVSPFIGYILHSALVALVSTVIVIGLGTSGAYAMVRFPYWFVGMVGRGALAAYMVPAILLLVPLTQVMYALHADNTLVGLVIVDVVLLLPFALWTLRAYFYGQAVDLEEAAMVDGCTRFGAFRRVVVPEAIPGMIAAGIFTFNASWGEYLFASTLVTDPQSTIVSPGLIQLVPTVGIEQWGMLLAGSCLMALPLLILFILFQRQLVESWGAGAVKG